MVKYLSDKKHIKIQNIYKKQPQFWYDSAVADMFYFFLICFVADMFCHWYVLSWYVLLWYVLRRYVLYVLLKVSLHSRSMYLHLHCTPGPCFYTYIALPVHVSTLTLHSRSMCLHLHCTPGPCIYTYIALQVHVSTLTKISKL